MLAGTGLGKRIKQLRRERHITAEAFAESVNISISFLREIERGNKKPALDNFIKIANELGVSADELLSDSIDSAKPTVVNRIAKTLNSVPKEQLGLIERVIETMVDELTNNKTI